MNCPADLGANPINRVARHPSNRFQPVFTYISRWLAGPGRTTTGGPTTGVLAIAGLLAMARRSARPPSNDEH
jgi:hypothetical protein